MPGGTLHAKRIDHNNSEVFLQSDGERSSLQVVKTTELLLAAARHSSAVSFDVFYGSLASIGSYVALTTSETDAIAEDLSLSFA
ncbi:hypothetical protein [Terriglobus roseus]|uniref:Uncharacterized protein n=1 Tax=Terriglobus roseus TaxID=392734 RepID=A0A1H4K0W7_9BACT|nr:hypothetical protein [Terriglobus roseus]SEB51936.1 hypothetical protein SAMN05443244_0929 [Terriglobus roseus]